MEIGSAFDWGTIQVTTPEQQGPTTTRRALVRITKNLPFLLDCIGAGLSATRLVQAAKDMKVTSSFVHYKRRMSAHELHGPALSIYRYIEGMCRTKEQLLDIQKYMAQCHKLLSGRAIDYFLTVLARNNHLTYYLLDAGDGQWRWSTERTPSAVPFILFHEYDVAVHTFTKAFFDVFDRGVSIDFMDTQISLPQTMFFMWCKRYLVIEYMTWYMGHHTLGARHIKRKLKSSTNETSTSSPTWTGVTREYTGTIPFHGRKYLLPNNSHMMNASNTHYYLPDATTVIRYAAIPPPPPPPRSSDE